MTQEKNQKIDDLRLNPNKKTPFFYSLFVRLIRHLSLKFAVGFLLFLGICFSLFFFSYKTLQNGIEIAKFDAFGVKIDGFYLKLNNKLDLGIKSLDLRGSSGSGDDFDVGEINAYAKHALRVLTYFERLNIEKIIVDSSDTNFVRYDGAEYFLSFENIYANFVVDESDGHAKLDIVRMYLPTFDLDVRGSLWYDEKDSHVDYDLVLTPLVDSIKKGGNYENLLGSVRVKLHGHSDFKELFLRVDELDLDSFEAFRKYVRLADSPDLEEWLFSNIAFKNLKILSLEANVELNKKRFLRSLKKTLKAEAVADEAKVKLFPEMGAGTGIRTGDGINAAGAKTNMDSKNLILESAKNDAEKITTKNLITAKKIFLNFKNDALNLTFNEPLLGEISLKDSTLSLKNLVEGNFIIDLNLRSNNGVLNNDVLGILKFYDIPLPITQTSGKMSVNLNMNFVFSNDFEDIDSKINGSINAKNIKLVFGQDLESKMILDSSNLALNFISNKKENALKIKEFDIALADMLKGKITGNLNLDSMKLNGELALNFIDISMPKINALNGSNFALNTDTNTTTPNIDKDTEEKIIEALNADNSGIDIALLAMDSQKIAFEIDFNHPANTTIQNKKTNALPVVEISSNLDENTSLKEQNLKADSTAKNTPKNTELDSKNNPTLTLLTIKDFSTRLEFDNTNKIYIDNLESLLPYSPILNYFDLTSGDVKIETDDFSAFNMSINLKKLNYPIYNKNGEKITQISLSGKADENEVNLTSKDKNIAVNKKNNRLKISLSDIDINANEIIESDIAFFKAINSDSKSKPLTQTESKEEDEFLRQKRRFERLNEIAPSITYLNAKNLTIHFDNYKIPTEMLDLSVRDGRVSASAEHGNGIAQIDIKHGVVYIKLNNFSGDFVNFILNKRLFDGGLFGFEGVLAQGELSGKMRLQNTIFKDFAILQNVLGLIDTIPSLIVFKKPGLGSAGYEIERGRIDVSATKENLGLSNINLVGTSIDITGNGVLDLTDKSLNFALEAHTMKSVSDILGNIPIVGFLILGEGGKISTNIILTGTLESPKSEISLLEDTIKAPLNILRRLFRPVEILIDGAKGKQTAEQTTEPSP